MGKRALWLPFFKGTNTIHKGPTHMTKLPPKDLTNTITLGVRLSILGTHIQFITQPCMAKPFKKYIIH